MLCSREAVKEKLTAALDVADVLITSGGVSMGEMVNSSCVERILAGQS